MAQQFASAQEFYYVNCNSVRVRASVAHNLTKTLKLNGAFKRFVENALDGLSLCCLLKIINVASAIALIVIVR